MCFTYELHIFYIYIYTRIYGHKTFEYDFCTHQNKAFDTAFQLAVFLQALVKTRLRWTHLDVL